MPHRSRAGAVLAGVGAPIRSVGGGAAPWSAGAGDVDNVLARVLETSWYRLLHSILRALPSFLALKLSVDFKWNIFFDII